MGRGLRVGMIGEKMVPQGNEREGEHMSPTPTSPPSQAFGTLRPQTRSLGEKIRNRSKKSCLQRCE